MAIKIKVTEKLIELPSNIGTTENEFVNNILTKQLKNESGDLFTIDDLKQAFSIYKQKYNITD